MLILLFFDICKRIIPSGMSDCFCAGLSYAVDQQGYSSMDIACTIIMLGQTCQASCKPLSSSGTWLAYAMVFSLCLGWLASVLHCCLSGTSTVLSSASNPKKIQIKFATITPFVDPCYYASVIVAKGDMRWKSFHVYILLSL